MPSLKVIVDGDGCWPDLARLIGTPRVIHLGNNAPAIQLALLDQGMQSGKPSIMLRIDLPDGRIVLAETSVVLFLTAAKIIASRHPDVLDT